MAKLNRVSIIGHVGADIELRKTNTNGVPVCNLRVAVNDSWKDKTTGDKREKTTWFTVVCYRGLAETVAKFMTSGKQVYVEGRLETREYMGKATDQAGTPIMYNPETPVMVRKFATEIIATDVQFLGKKPSDTAYAADGSAAAAQPAAGTFVPAPGAAATPVATTNAQATDVAGTFVKPVEVQMPDGV
jgi:single-strand DNA-binding protein